MILGSWGWGIGSGISHCEDTRVSEVISRSLRGQAVRGHTMSEATSGSVRWDCFAAAPVAMTYKLQGLIPHSSR